MNRRVAYGVAASTLAVGLWSGFVRVGPDPDAAPPRCTDELNVVTGRCDPPSPATCADAWNLEAPTLGPAGTDQVVHQAFILACEAH